MVLIKSYRDNTTQIQRIIDLHFLCPRENISEVADCCLFKKIKICEKCKNKRLIQCFF